MSSCEDQKIEVKLSMDSNYPQRHRKRNAAKSFESIEVNMKRRDDMESPLVELNNSVDSETSSIHHLVSVVSPDILDSSFRKKNENNFRYKDDSSGTIPGDAYQEDDHERYAYTIKDIVY